MAGLSDILAKLSIINKTTEVPTVDSTPGIYFVSSDTEKALCVVSGNKVHVIFQKTALDSALNLALDTKVDKEDGKVLINSTKESNIPDDTNAAISAKANFSDLQNVVGGLRNNGEVDDLTALNAITGMVDGDAYKVLSVKDSKGNSYIYRYTVKKDTSGTVISATWVNTKLVALDGDIAYAGGSTKTLYDLEQSIVPLVSIPTYPGITNIEFVSDRKWLFAISFGNKVYAGLKYDGQLYFNSSKIDSIQNLVNSIQTFVDSIGDISILQNITISSDRKWLFAITYGNEIYMGIKRNGKIYFNSEFDSRLTTAESKIADLEAGISASMNLVCWGDSLTWGAGQDKIRNKSSVLSALTSKGFDVTSLSNAGYVTYPIALQALIGTKATVYNEGVGGETLNSIGARQGAWNSKAQTAFVLPANMSTVEIGNETIGYLISTYDDSLTKVLTQADNTHVNPCYVEGIECTLSVTKDSSGVVTNYYLARNNIGARDVTIPANTPILFSGGKKYRKTDIAILWCFQNGGYSDIDDLVTKIRKIADNIGTDKFLVVGLHTWTESVRADRHTALRKEFGDKFFDWGRYVSTNALYDFGITPTTNSDFTADQLANGVASDATQISVGGLPSSLWRVVYGVPDYTGATAETSNDSTHMNSAGYIILAYKLYERMLQLGYIN